MNAAPGCSLLALTNTVCVRGEWTRTSEGYSPFEQTQAHTLVLYEWKAGVHLAVALRSVRIVRRRRTPLVATLVDGDVQQDAQENNERKDLKSSDQESGHAT